MLKRIAAAVAFAMSLTSPAAAQHMTFVAVTGNDANNTCLVEARPCKTLQKALTVTAANGEVRLLSGLPGGGTITKSVTIDGAGNTITGRIVISNASANVTLRRLTLNGRGGTANGIVITSAAAIFIEDSIVERFTSDGISIITSAATKLFLSNIVVRGNRSDGLHVEATAGQADIQDSRFEGNGHTGAYLKLARVTVKGSIASGNGAGGLALRSVKGSVDATAANDNSGNGFIVYEGEVYLSSATGTGNSAGGLLISSGAQARISGCKFVNNSGTSLRIDGLLYSYGDNLVHSYTGDGTMLDVGKF